jgi:probable rRNA maturation factor
LVSDETVAGLNEEYLSHEGPTDVISFPLGDERRIVGDVYIGLEQAARQAEEFGVSRSEEILRLTIHGMLHILGWDHPEDGSRTDSPMYRRQEELLIGFMERRLTG